jgi:L-fuconolactonase
MTGVPTPASGTVASIRVDAHHHFWDPGRADYPWMTDALAAIRRPFGPDDLRPLIDRAGIDRTVLVQTRSSLEETREFLAIAAETEFVAGVVGWVELTGGQVGDALAELRAGPGGDRLVAIRHQVHDEDDAEWLCRPDVRRGIEAVGRAGLAYDLLVRTRELPAAVDTVRALPDVPFVVDHIAKPPIATGELEPWAENLAAIAACPNVCCKLSGMLTEADWERWTIDDLRPYVDVVLEVFGPGRLMFGSDWPVSLLAADYQRVVDATRELLGELTPDEQAGVFGRNATRFYALPPA